LQNLIFGTDKDAGKSESLLLAPGECLIPRRLLLKTIDEVLEPHALKRLGNLLDALTVRGLRIGRGTAQCSDRNVGPLRPQAAQVKRRGRVPVSTAPSALTAAAATMNRS
jgi:hypothetical protein